MKKLQTFNTDALGPLMKDSFVFGVGTAAYQIEGAAQEDGRTDSVWDTFCRQPGNIADHSSGEIACDHYHRWRDDLALLVELGVDVYRFSVSWSRVIPHASGAVNKAGLEFYQQLAEELRNNDIRPMVTLHHWDLPQYLQDQGGWQNRDTAYRFVEYAAAVANGFANSVDFYTTINEPWCIANLGHLTGVHAPGLKEEAASDAATHHLLLGHGLAIAELRSLVPKAELGIVLNGGPSHPLTESNADAEAADLFESEQIHRFAGPLLAGVYPEEFMPRVEGLIQAGDLQCIAEPCDYLGWNYYTRNVVEQGADGTAVAVSGTELPVTDMGWEIYPAGLSEVCSTLSEKYDLPPLYISENGAAFSDTRQEDAVHDADRIHYIQQHLEVVADMIRIGIDVRGYVCWTLLDNFEWAEGYEKRFGLVRVDYDTQQRTIKDSGKAFANLMATKAALNRARNDKRENVAP